MLVYDVRPCLDHLVSSWLDNVVQLTPSDIFKQNDPLVDALDCGSLLVQCVCPWSIEGND